MYKKIISLIAKEYKQLRKIFYSPAETDEGRFYEVRLMREMENIKDIAAMFRQLPEVEFVETLHWMRSTLTPNDCLFNSNSGCYSSTWEIEQWGLKNDGKVVTAYTGPDIPESRFDADVDADLAWDITTGDDTIIVAFIDTGLDWGHPEFSNNLWVNPLEDANADGAFQLSDLGDINGDGYPGTRSVDDDNDGGTDFNDPDIRYTDYDCDGVRLCGPDSTVGTGDDDPEDFTIAANDDDENGLPDDIIGWDFTDSQWCNPINNYPGDWDVSTTDPSGTASPHGNLVTSIAAAEGNNNGSGELDKAMAGVVWDSRIMTLRASHDAQFNPAVVATAIDYARLHHANIINLSMGTSTDVTTLSTAVQNAINAGCFIVASAGNDDQSTTRTYPASYPNVCGVMGSNRSDLKDGISNYNNSQTSEWYDIMAPSDSITALIPLDQVNDPNNMDDYYTLSGGTSSAAPFVTGTVALMKSAYPLWTNPDILYQLNNMADNIDTLQPSMYKGKFGHGRLNAARSLGIGAISESVYWKFHKSWEKRAFIADTMVVDSSVILTLNDSLVIYNAVGNMASGDGRGGLRLVEGAQLIVPDNSMVTLPGKFYVNIGQNCHFIIGKNSILSFGDSCTISLHNGSIVKIDTNAVVNFGKNCLVEVKHLGTLSAMPKATVKLGSNSSINVYGKVISKASAGNEITFTLNGNPLIHPPWNGFYFYAQSPNYEVMPCEFNYTTIKYAKVGIETLKDSVLITNCLFQYDSTGVKGVSASPKVDDNVFKTNYNVALHLNGQYRTVKGNRMNSNPAFGIIADATTNVWNANHADSNNVGLQLYNSSTSVFRSNSTSDTLSGNTFRYNLSRGIVSDNSSPTFTSANDGDAFNTCHDNNSPTADIDALNYSVVYGVGNYVLNGVTLYSDGTSSLTWGKEKMWDPIPNAPAPGNTIASTFDTLKQAIVARLQGNYSNSISILKNMIERNHGGAYAKIALRLVMNVLNDAEFILRNNDQISRNIVTARNNFDDFLSTLKSNSPSTTLRKFAAEMLAHHKLIRRQYASAESLFEALVSTYPNTDIEKRSLYAQAIVRKIIENQSGAKEKSDLLRSKYPDDYIGVVAKLFINDPLSEAEREMITRRINPAPMTRITSKRISGFTLHQNYPNPFNPVTQIAFEIPKACRVHVTVVDALGREIEVLTNSTYEAGYHSLRFDASHVPSGLYFYKMAAGKFVAVKKMAVMK